VAGNAIIDVSVVGRQEVEMDRRRVAVLASAAWSVVGAVIAFASLPQTNTDARVFVGVASVLGPVAGFVAAVALVHRRQRVAGALLVVSAIVTPTYFAYALNVVPLLGGTVLSIAPRVLERPASRRHVTE
jgi:peptidoglycan/LPS O-acetylase OafA/YrhL